MLSWILKDNIISFVHGHQYNVIVSTINILYSSVSQARKDHLQGFLLDNGFCSTQNRQGYKNKWRV